MRNAIKIAAAVATAAAVLVSGGNQPAWSATDVNQGIFEGLYSPAEGKDVRAVAHVMGLGNQRYRAVITADAPGMGKKVVLEGQVPGKLAAFFKGRELRLEGMAGDVVVTATLGNGRLHAKAAGPKGGELFLRRIERMSPNAELPPPEGAVVLLPFAQGRKTSLEKWTNKRWDVLDDGSVAVRNGESRSRDSFGDCRLHAEFWLPYEPDGRGQGRGNSGLYFQNLYEVQVLDSFGLQKIGQGDCGGIYNTAVPRVNASLPPETWQTYDVTFRAPRFDANDKMTEPARISVIHNGIKIHDNVAVPQCTEGPGRKLVKRGPIKLQDHGHPVRYRNIWLVELND